MRREMTTWSRAGVRTLAAASLLAIAACDLTDSLLEVKDPDIINPDDVQNAEGAIALANGALDFFRNTTGGAESTWLFGGLLADEWSTSSTFVQNDETDQRKIQTNNSTITGMFRDLGRTRLGSNLAIRGLKQFAPDPPRRIAEVYFARGFAEMQLAQDFCNGIPLSEIEGDVIIPGQPLTVAEVFQRAIASYDSALALLATNTDTSQAAGSARSIRRAALVAKARAMVGLNQVAQAAALVDSIPLSFAYNHTFAITSGDNILWAQPASARRYTVGDSIEGNARTDTVRNAIPFFTARDPRLPVTYTIAANGRDTVKSQDGQTNSRTTTLYGRSTPLPVVSGLDARLIVAEAELRDKDYVGMMAILNGLRASPPKLGEVQPAVMAALPVPTDSATAVSVYFREKAFWTFSRGQRLGDLRRLIRQYGRTPETTFPVGRHYKGGVYGVDVNLPVPKNEEGNNPNFSGCLDRNA
jgi:starch-binding outer membrane protein, SusD/RagB family